MKTYKQLFLEIANSTDYTTNKLTGASWRYYVDEDDKRVYVQFQETKTILDWLYNFLIFPVKLKTTNGSIRVPLGNYLQFKSVYKDILEAIKPYSNSKYDVYGTGWSQGGVTVGLFFFYTVANKVDMYWNKCIMYGTPKFLKDDNSVATYESVVEYENFLYPDDPIRDVVPGYKRVKNTVSDGYVPDFEPVTLDDKHRIYGHSTYTDFEGRSEF